MEKINIKQKYVALDINDKINIKRIAQRVNSNPTSILKYVIDIEIRFNILKDMLKTIRSNK